MLFQLISAIVKRSEFLLVFLFKFFDYKENCGFVDNHTALDPQIKNQLVQYIFLLKLSLLYTPRAIVLNAVIAREFVFAVVFLLFRDLKVISASIIRIPEYRMCFFTQLQTTIKNTVVEGDAGVGTIAFNKHSSSFIDKYIDPALLRSLQTPNPPSSSNLVNSIRTESHHISMQRGNTGVEEKVSVTHLESEAEILNPIEEDFPSVVSDALIDDHGIDVASRSD